MISKLKRQQVTAYRVKLVKQLEEEGDLNNQQIADIFKITRENVRKLLLKRRSNAVK